MPKQEQIEFFKGLIAELNEKFKASEKVRLQICKIGPENYPPDELSKYENQYHILNKEYADIENKLREAGLLSYFIDHDLI